MNSFKPYYEIFSLTVLSYKETLVDFDQSSETRRTQKTSPING